MTDGLTRAGLMRFGEVAAAHVGDDKVPGLVALALIREGLLGLDEPVDRLLPDLAHRRVLRRMDGPLDETVPAAGAITVRDLLRAGTSPSSS